MNLQQRVEAMVKLGEYMSSNSSDWLETKQNAYQKNQWFIPEFIDHAIEQIVEKFLDRDQILNWVAHYHLDDNIDQKNVGIVMAGNIPLVGFHDFLCVYISGHKQTIKLSSKDDVLMNHLLAKLRELDPQTSQIVAQSELLKGCDAYIATGSNNTARYFEEYFGKYPNIIRKNRTSVAVLTGSETSNELEKLSDDIHLYYGLGCRNVTKIFVPRNYDFVPLIQSFNKYSYLADYNKYKNNYDYHLAIAMMNNAYYMTNGSTLLIENNSPFSPISVVHYEFYDDLDDITLDDSMVQCIQGKNFLPFGSAQHPGLFDYADGIDTMQFLLSIS